MKKLSVNKNDCSFENKYKFADLFNKVKAVGGSIIKNGKQTCVLGVMTGCVLFSANSIYKLGTEIVEAVEYFNAVSELDKDIISKNDDVIQQINSEAILAANVRTSLELKYHFENNNLYDNEGNITTLNGVEKPIYFTGCNLSEETFQNIHLSSSQTKDLCLDYSSIDDNFINYLPNTVEKLSLNNCNYITNLNELPRRCSNITVLSLNANSSLSDLSFIYQLPNLKEIYIVDSVYITEELLTYLKTNNITTNLTEQDLINSQKVDEIINTIITPDMSDKEKIQAVCLYVLNNVEYDIKLSEKSNKTPLSCVLEEGKGVCASYAYFTNVLLNKAGIESFEIINDSHAWNTIKSDDKYYYVDTTAMDGSAFYNFLLRILNMSKYYMVDTNNTLISAMSDPTDETTIIPMSLIEDIQAGRDEKDLFEKYSGLIGEFGVILGFVLSGLSIAFGPGILKRIITEEIPDLYYYIREDYDKKRR